MEEEEKRERRGGRREREREDRRERERERGREREREREGERERERERERETLDRMIVVACNSQMLAKADSTLGCSQAVPHPSTNRALCRLTSEVRRDPVHSTRYGRRRTK